MKSLSTRDFLQKSKRSLAIHRSPYKIPAEETVEGIRFRAAEPWKFERDI